jgi:hypothetical protein
MNEIENIDLTGKLPSEGEGEILTSLFPSQESQDKIKGDDEIEKILLEIEKFRNETLDSAYSWTEFQEDRLLQLEDFERFLRTFLSSSEKSQEGNERYDSIKKTLLELKAVITDPYTVERQRNEEKKKASLEKLESYLPVKNINELRRIKDECIDDKEFFGILLCKILVINGEHFNLQNYEALERLELEKECWDELESNYNTKPSSYEGSIKPVDLDRFVTLKIRGLYGEDQSKSFNFKKRVDYLYSVVKMLLDNYGENIKLSLRVTVEGKIIDLFVRLAPKPAFALMIRSYGDASVIWRSDKQDFYVTSKRRKGTDKWNSLSKAIVQLKSVFALKKEKNPVLGVSKAERTAPIIRAIVLAEGTEIDTNRNSPDLRVEFGKAPALKIVTDTITYVVEQKHLIDFLTPPDN